MTEKIDYPAKIETAQRTILNLYPRVNEFKEDLGQIDDGLWLDVLNAKNEDGKLMFTNDKQREIAHRQAQRDSQVYQESFMAYESAVSEQLAQKIALERYRNEFYREQVNKLQDKEFVIAPTTAMV